MASVAPRLQRWTAGRAEGFDRRRADFGRYFGRHSGRAIIILYGSNGYEEETVDSREETDIYGNLVQQVDDHGPPNEIDIGVEIGGVPANNDTDEPPAGDGPVEDVGEDLDDTPVIPKGRSIAHHDLTAGRVVFVSFDLEYEGDRRSVPDIGRSCTHEARAGDDQRWEVVIPKGYTKRIHTRGGNIQ